MPKGKPRRNQWVLLGACGCPSGVMEEYLARDAGEAFAEFYDYNRDQVRAARDRNMQIVLVSFDEYNEKYYDLMFDPCPH